jgi:Heterokaryon incompatibility protein (HET)
MTKMAQAAPLTPGSIMERIFQLEDQVRGLMETVTKLHEAFKLQSLKIPKPNQYTRTGRYTKADLQQRMAAATALAAPSTVSATPSPPVRSQPPIVSAQAPAPTYKISDLARLKHYKYAPLMPKDRQIRVLALHSSSSPLDPIVCEMRTNTLIPELGKVFYYNPLPYCWGSTAKTEKIIVDGHVLDVTPSLHRALARFRTLKLNILKASSRLQDESLWWIDAICI